MNRIVTRLTFNIIRPIGNEGANSQTFLAFDPQLNAELVVKSIPKTDFNMHEEKYFLESKILYNNKHPNIMEINYACEDDNNIYLSMPYHKNGSLNSLLNIRYLTVREIVEYSLDFLSGLHFIHTNELIHFDVKPTNIIISDSNHALLTDFGLSKYIDENGFATPEKIYKSHWAPEALITPDLTSQFDIYQAGLTLYRMCNGNEDFYNQKTELTRDSILNGIFPVRDKFLPPYPKTTKKVYKKSLEVDPNNRYKSVLELMNDICMIDNNLDWTYKRSDENETWFLEGDKVNKLIILSSSSVSWSIEGYSINKNSGKRSKITKAFSNHPNKEKAYKEINKIIDEI